MRHLSLLSVVLATLCLTGCPSENAADAGPKDSLSKKAAKAMTKTALDVVEGVAEAVEEHGAKATKAVTKAAGEVGAGAAAGTADVMDKHGEQIGKNLVHATDDLATGVAHGVEEAADAHKAKRNAQKAAPARKASH